MPETSTRLAFGCRFGTAGLKIIARNFAAPYLRLSLRRGWTENYCPKLQRVTTSVHGFDAADARALPEFSPRLAFGCQPCTMRPDRKLLPETSPRLTFGCRSGAAGQKIVVRFFTAPCFRLSAMRGQTENYCLKLHRALLSVVAPARRDKKSLPGFSPRLALGCRSGAAGQKFIARFFTATCFRLSLRRDQTKIHCPKLQRGLSSVHGIVAAAARALPGFSPRLAFGCRLGTVREKIIARNFNATLPRCMELSRQSPGHCPVFHRDLLSVVVRVRPEKNSLPEISTRP